jgi:uncharacterized membrane protein
MPTRTTAVFASRVALIGLAAGSRATVGVAIPTTFRASTHQRDRGVRALAVAAIAGELIWDQLPNCPSRLEWQGLVSRIVSGGVGGVVIARSSKHSALAAAVIGSTSAVAGAFIGARWRQRWSRHHAAWAGGVIEDAVALTIAAVATR